MYVPGYPIPIAPCDPSGAVTIEEAVTHIYRSLNLLEQIKGDLDRDFSIGSLKISFSIGELNEFKRRYEEQIKAENSSS